MKWTRSLLVVTASLALAPAVAWGQFTPGAGLAGTPHDFSTPGAGGAGTTQTETVGLCTFCHTPHKAQMTSLLWNHTLSSSNFSWSDATTTTGGTNYPTINGQTYTGPTTKCLSCHDGTVAIGDIGWWKEEPRTSGSTGGVVNTMKHMAPEPANIANGAEMKGNHPVAMPFPFNGVVSTYNGNTTGTLALASGWVSDPTANGIRLFNDGGGSGTVVAGAVAGNTGIECSSCHDPHNKDAQDDLFLRGMLTGNTGGASGYICLKCHNK